MNTSSLHEALTAYMQSLDTRSSGQLRPSDHHRRSMVRTFKDHSADLPLGELTYEGCSSLIQHWRLRPATKTGRPYSHASAQAFIKELVRFFKWLDTTSEFTWRLPHGFDAIERKVVRISEDRNVSQRTREVYSVSELSLLNEYATDPDRLILYLAMNCGLGPVDLLRLKADHFLFDHQHEQAVLVGLSSSDRHSYLRLVRPKNRMFCEWMLWDETADVVRRAIQRSASLKTDYLLVTDDGQPLLREGVRNPSSPIQYRYRRLINRVQADHPDFRQLPFGSLRQSMSEMIRHFASSETVGLYLGHLSQSVNNRHSTAPFGLLHRALRLVRSQLKPVLNNPKNNGAVT